MKSATKSLLSPSRPSNPKKSTERQVLEAAVIQREHALNRPSLEALEAEADRRGYFGDARQEFFCAALEAGFAAGHEAVRVFLNAEVTASFQIHGIRDFPARPTADVDRNDDPIENTVPKALEGSYDPRAELEGEQAEHEELEPEIDSAEQHELLEALVAKMPAEDRSIMLDHFAGVAQDATAKRLGCSQPNVSARLAVLTERLRAAVDIATNPIDTSELDALTEPQRAAVTALLAGARYSPSTVRRAAMRLPEGARKHLLAKLRHGRWWARGSA